VRTDISALIGRLIINVKHVEDNKMTLAACLPLPDCPFEGQEGEITSFIRNNAL
jgi:hypothetical protein